MRGAKFENDLTDMQSKPTAEMAMKYAALIVGVLVVKPSGLLGKVHVTRV